MFRIGKTISLSLNEEMERPVAANAHLAEDRDEPGTTIVRNDPEVIDVPDRFYTKARKIYSRARKPRFRAASIF